MNRLRLAGSLLALGFVSPALADVPPPGGGPNRDSTQGDRGPAAGTNPTGGAKWQAPPAKPPLPVKLTVVAPTPDPPWTMRIENTGDHAIRIAADIRLLSFELERGGKGGTMKCAAPAGLRPTAFPSDRELYLQPGEVYAEQFDPRLYCFQSATDALTGGTTVHPHYGFSGGGWGKVPFAAEGIDRPEAFAALPQMDGPTILLSYRAVEPPTSDPTAPPSDEKGSHPKSDKAAGEGAGDKKPRAHHCDNGDGAKGDGEKPIREVAAHGQAGKPIDPYAFDWTATCDDKKSADDAPPTFVDLNQPHMDVYVDRFADAHAARDIVVSIKAENEGKRDLVTLLRSRMLSFTVEELGPDNKAKRTMDCPGSERPHGVPAESLRDLGGGQAMSIPLLVAEMCAPGTFDRPGLYRVLPRLDTSVAGEGLTLHAFLGKALARQSTLVRVATGRDAFEEPPPKVEGPPPADVAKPDAASPRP